MTPVAFLGLFAAVLVGPVTDELQPPTAPPGGAATARAEAVVPEVTWSVLEHLDAPDRDLILGFAQAARSLSEARYALARRFPAQPLEIQIRDDLSRVRWRDRTDPAAPWIEAAVCPEDRAIFTRREGALPAGDPDRPWRTLQTRGDRVIAPATWGHRALLLREDGGTVRLIRLD